MSVAALHMLLDMMETDVLPDLIVELAERFKQDPAKVHAIVEQAWLDFRAARERVLEYSVCRPEDLGPTRGSA